MFGAMVFMGKSILIFDVMAGLNNKDRGDTEVVSYTRDDSVSSLSVCLKMGEVSGRNWHDIKKIFINSYIFLH